MIQIIDQRSEFEHIFWTKSCNLIFHNSKLVIIKYTLQLLLLYKDNKQNKKSYSSKR